MALSFSKSAQKKAWISVVKTTLTGGSCEGLIWCSLVFIVGQTTPAIDSRLQNESRNFGDILQEPFQDSYNNLTLKTIFLLKHFVRDRPRLNFLLKVDDNCYVNLGEFLHLFFKLLVIFYP